MPGSTNFQIFDPNQENMVDDVTYAGLDYRMNGARTGRAPSNVHNKLYYQTSIMAAAIAQVFADRDFAVSDANFANLVAVLSNLALKVDAKLWQPGTVYAVGDIAYTGQAGGSNKRIECVIAGTSGAVEPAWGAFGTLKVDNGVTWIVDDVRDGLAPGDWTSSIYVRPGRLKLNGTLIDRAAYPRLTKIAIDNGLVVSEGAWAGGQKGMFGAGDGLTTLRLPDKRGTSARTLDEGAGLDPGRVLGSYQADQVISHYHSYIEWGGTDIPATFDLASMAGHYSYTGTGSYGGSETRGKNIAEYAVIRY